MTSTLPPPPPRSEDRVDTPSFALWRISPSTGVLASLGAGGIAIDLGVRHPIGILSFVAVAAMAGAGVRGGWIRGPLARRLALLTLAPASMLVLRDSPWLKTINLAAIAGLLLLAVAVRAEPHPISRALGRLLHPSAAEPVMMSADLALRSARAAAVGRDDLGRRLMRLVRGIALGAPILGALILLLAASDALFRSWLRVPFDPTGLLGHGAVILVGAALTAAFAAQGAWADVRPTRRPRRVVGASEATVVLLGVVVVYAAFVATQVTAIAAGAGYVERSTGLTYSEYARAGFFQLVAAAVFTLVVLVLMRRHRRTTSPRLARRLTALELSTVALTLTVVGVAVRRLFLYEAELGLTMLRFSTIVFALFIGFVFVVCGLWIAGRLRSDAVDIVLVGALVTIIAVNLVNPERLVAQRNIDRFGGTEQLDIDYLVDNLGADAYPAMVGDDRVAARMCSLGLTVDDRPVVFNWSRFRAADALDSTC